MAGIYPDSGVAASAATNTVNVPTNNCDSELFHSTTRCTPRFDPASANAVMSEILNTVASTENTTYNCNRLDNLSLAVADLVNTALDDTLTGCISDDTYDGISEKANTNNFEILGIATEDGCNQFRRIPDFGVEFTRLFEEAIVECIEAELPDVSDVGSCETPLYLTAVPSEDGTCFTIATFSTASSTNARIRNTLVEGTVPDEFPVANLHYESADIIADYPNNINEATIINSRLNSGDFDLDCETRMSVRTTVYIDHQGEGAGDQFDRRFNIRYRYRVDGGTWVYQETVAGGFAVGNGYSSLNDNVTATDTITFPAGNIEYETFYISYTGVDRSRLSVTTTPAAPTTRIETLV